MISKHVGSQMQRLDAGFVAYLRTRAKREHCTVVEISRRMLAAVRPSTRRVLAGAKPPRKGATR